MVDTRLSGMSPSTDAPSGADVSARFSPLAAAPAVVPPAVAPAPADSSDPVVYDERDRLVLLTPCYGHLVSTEFRDSVTLAQQYPTARFRCTDGRVRILPVLAGAQSQPGDSHIDRARNTALWHFLQRPYRFGCWMDGDQPFQPEHLARIWAHLMSGKRVVGGLVAAKTIVPTFVCNATHGQRPDAAGLIQPDDIGTGCLGFNRNVVEEIIARWPQYVRERLSASMREASSDEIVIGGPNDPIVDAVIQTLAELGYSADLAYKANSNTATAGQTMHALFRSGIAWRDGAPDWLSEDWMFCHMCKLLGIPIYADTQINIRHIGPMIFPPEPAEIVEAALKVTSGRQPPFDPALARRAADALRALHADISDQSITILHATRSRPAQALRVRQLWLERALTPGHEYIFGVDEDDQATRAALAAAGARMVVVKGGRGIVEAINAAAREATGRILIMAADDCEPPPQWDREIREALKGQLHLPRLLWTSDGYSQQPVITHPIMTRALYTAQGWFFCPEYAHLFCDTDLTVRAAAAGQIVDGRHIELRHQHPMFTHAAPDALHQARNNPDAWAAGLAIFRRRNPDSKHPHAHPPARSHVVED